MTYLCCTRTLAKDLKLDISQASSSVSRGVLGNWYVHVVRILRRKMLLFVKAALQAEGFSSASLQTVLENSTTILHTKATNRRVIAKRLLTEYAMVSPSDSRGVSAVLNAAAWTYVAAAATAVLNLLYLLWRTGLIGGRR